MRNQSVQDELNSVARSFQRPGFIAEGRYDGLWPKGVQFA
jgi:hypothetical protein